MASKVSYLVGGEEFQSKAELQRKVREILYAYRPGETLNYFDFICIYALLQRHPAAKIKIGRGVVAIVVRENPIYPGTRGFSGQSAKTAQKPISVIGNA